MEIDGEDDDLFRCALCGTSESDASNLTTQSALQTNATVGCGHQFCNSCVERELSRRKTFPCPICETPVKRVTLSTRTLDDVQCEKDTSWRRRVLKVYNKAESDFPSLLEYNNYLEMVEDITSMSTLTTNRDMRMANQVVLKTVRLRTLDNLGQRCEKIPL